MEEPSIIFSGAGSAVINHSLAAVVLSAAAVAVFIWWFPAGLIPLAAYIALAILAVASVPLLYRFSGYALADDVEWLDNRESEEHDALMKQLQQTRTDLITLEIDEGVEQADVLSRLMDDYHSVVETRFRGNQFSPLNYLSAARTVQRHAIQNLTDVAAVGHSISTINRNRFESDDSQKTDQQDELQEQQQTRLNNLLEENRDLFDALTNTAVEVANIKSFSRFEKLDTLTRLVTLAEIAKKRGK